MKEKFEMVCSTKDIREMWAGLYKQYKADLNEFAFHGFLDFCGDDSRDDIPINEWVKQASLAYPNMVHIIALDVRNLGKQKPVE